MIEANDIRRTILNLAEERGLSNTFNTSDVARKINAENLTVIMQQIEFVAGVLIKEGKIEITDGLMHHKRM